jgi:hypothetical protein
MLIGSSGVVLALFRPAALLTFLNIYLLCFKGVLDILVVIIDYFNELNTQFYIAILHLRCSKQKNKTNERNDYK